MKIDNLTLKNNILLAPMSGVTDFPYREIIKKLQKENEMLQLRLEV